MFTTKKPEINQQKPAVDKSPKLETQEKASVPMSSQHKRKILLGVMCFLTGVALLTYLVPQVSAKTKNVYEIVTVAKDVKCGEKLDSSHVAVIKTSDEEVAKEFANATSEVVGKYAATDLTRGEYILRQKLWVEDATDVYSRLETGYMTMSVTFDTFASSMSSQLRKGDIVSVLGILGTANTDADISAENYQSLATLKPELRYVEVIDVSNEQMGKAVDNAKPTSSAEEESPVLSTVTLRVTEQQAKLLVDFEHTGYLHLALSYRGDKSVANEYVKTQQDYLNDLKSQAANEAAEPPVDKEVTDE